MLEGISTLLSKIWWQLLIAFALWVGIFLYIKRNPQKILERIEKDGKKVNMGTEQNPEWVYFKKSGFITKEWHIIYPPVNEDGTTNKTNLWFGGKGNAIKLAVIFGLMLLLVLGIYQIISSYNEILANPAVQNCLTMAGVQLS